MAIALVGVTNFQGQGTTPALDTTGASLLVIAICGFPATGGIGAPGDSAGNTYVPHIGANGSFGQQTCVFVCESPITSPTHTWNNLSTNATGTDNCITVEAWSGTGATDQVATAAGVDDGMGHYLTPSFTPAHDGELVLSWSFAFSPDTLTIIGGFTIDVGSLGDGSNCNAAHLIQTTAAPAQAGWSGYNFVPSFLNISFQKASAPVVSAFPQCLAFAVMGM